MRHSPGAADSLSPWGLMSPNITVTINSTCCASSLHAAHGIAAGGDAWAAHVHCSGWPACLLLVSPLLSEKEETAAAETKADPNWISLLFKAAVFALCRSCELASDELSWDDMKVQISPLQIAKLYLGWEAATSACLSEHLPDLRSKF